MYDTIEDRHYYYESQAKCRKLTGLSDKSLRSSLNNVEYLIKNRYKATTIEFNNSLNYETLNMELINGRLLQYAHPEYYKYLVHKDHDVYPLGGYDEEWLCAKCGDIFTDTPFHVLISNKQCLCEKCKTVTWSYPERFMYFLLKDQ